MSNKPQPIDNAAPRQASAGEKAALTQQAVANEERPPTVADLMEAQDKLAIAEGDVAALSAAVRSFADLLGTKAGFESIRARIRALLAHEAVEVGGQSPSQRFATLLRPGFDHLVDEQTIDRLNRERHASAERRLVAYVSEQLSMGADVSAAQARFARDGYAAGWTDALNAAKAELRGPT